MNVKGLRRIRLRAATYEVDNELLERSAAARVGHRMIQLAIIVRSVEPVLMLVAAVLLMGIGLAQPALAQGSIFGQNDQAVGSGLREAIRWGRNLIFLLGVVFGGWAAVNVGMERAWGKQALGSALCFGFGGLIALIQSFSKGNAVDLNTDLGD